MIKYFINAFKITNENIVLTTPFIMYLLLVGVFIGFTGNLTNSVFSAIFLLLTLLFMTAAFLAGWFYMVQYAVDTKQENDSQEEKSPKPMPVIQTLTSGVGNYFLSFVFGIILMSALIFLFVITCKYIGGFFIGKVSISYDALRNSAVSNEQLKAFLSTVPSGELVKISKWNFLILTAVSIYAFITMFWASAIIKTDKNPFFAFFKALAFTFKNFLDSIVLFIYITALNLCITMLSGICAGNNILYFISTLIYFYFMVYIVVLVFLFYNNEQKSKLGQYCDVLITEEDYKKENKNENEDNSNNGTDSNRQE